MAGGGSTLTVTASATVAPGAYTVTVTGAAASNTHSVSVTVNVTAAPSDFAISASPASLTVVQGNSGTSTISTTLVTGTPDAISLSVTSSPGGLGWALNPVVVNAGATSTLTVIVGGVATPGVYILTVTGVEGSATHSTSVTVTVTTAPSDFAILSSPSSLTIAQGNSGTSTIGTLATAGREEGGAAYCRGAAIVLPQNMIAGSTKALEQILPHELFHVLSSHNPLLREALYQTIGFESCNEVQLPEPLRARKITNPDAPVNNHFITVTQDGRALELMPVLFSKTERYDPARGGSLFTYMQFKLMALENDNGTRRPALVDGQGVLLEPRGVPGYHEQVGRNTTYIIHPEEILADNFVFLLDGRINMPTPRVVQQMGKVLQAADTN
jgi:hypothetical protein